MCFGNDVVEIRETQQDDCEYHGSTETGTTTKEGRTIMLIE